MNRGVRGAGPPPSLAKPPAPPHPVGLLADAVVLGAAVWPGGRPSPALARRAARAATLSAEGKVCGIVACGGFGAICGSSIATTATMARIAMPEMERRGYSLALCTGSLAAGGTLGSLVPPSVIMVIYAVQVEQFIIDLFIGAMRGHAARKPSRK